MRNESDRSLARRTSVERDEPIMQLVLEALDRVSKRQNKSITLLAVNPNSLSVLKSGLRSAKRYNAPIIFTCTLNQVDLDGGYTTWTQFDFVKLVREEAKKADFDGPIIIASDHYGPWLKDEHTRKQLSYDDTMAGVKQSLEACLDAGFDYLHIDATMCPGLTRAERMSKVVERTLEMIEYTESLRKDKGLPRITYEVGTEEVAGGISEPELVSMFLGELKEKMTARDLGDAWPSMLVGNIGTNLHTTTFDFEGAKALYKMARRYGLHLKGHYTDYVERLQDYPKVPIRAANVGPRFANAEFDTLRKLADTEAGCAEPSNISDVLMKAVVDSGRWKKWLQESEARKDFSQLQKDRQLWLLRTGSRYIWMTRPVVGARARLDENLRARDTSAEEEVLKGIDAAMHEFFVPFNLRDSTTAITDELNGSFGGGAS